MQCVTGLYYYHQAVTSLVFDCLCTFSVEIVAVAFH